MVDLKNGDTEITQMVGNRTLRKKADKRKSKIEVSRYNDNYKNLTTKNIPEYLNKEKKSMKRSLISRYRCRNEIRES